MRIGPEALCAVALVVLAVGIGRAEDQKPATAANPASATNPAGGLFQSLSLGSGKGPVQIDSDTLELDYKTSHIVYRGNVQVVQGDVTLTSDTLSITYDPRAVKRATDDAPALEKTATPKSKNATPGGDADRIKEIIAEGNVKIRQGTKLAEGKRAVFDQAKQTFTLSDGAVLHDGPNQVAGERVIVYLKEDRSVVESGSNSRVKAVLYPGKDDADGATKATALSIQAAPTPGAPQKP